MKQLTWLKRWVGLCVLGLMVGGGSAAHAAENGTPAEAEAMTKRAVAYLKANGPEKSAQEFTHGKLFIQMISEVAKTKGKGWTDTYKFRNPTTDKIAEKLIYVERVNDTWIGVGVYK